MEYEPLRYIKEPEPHELLGNPGGFEIPEKSLEPEEKLRPENIFVPSERKNRKWKRYAFFSVVLLVCLYIFFLRPTGNFPADTILQVEKGETLSGITLSLETSGVIRSPFFFKVFMTFFGGSRGLVAGDYYLEEPQNTLALAWRLSNGVYNLKNIRITIPEGTSSSEIADLFVKEKRFAHFDPDEFMGLAAPYEGYLFPDTYLFLPNVTAAQVVDAMLATYQSRVETLAGEIREFKRPIKDIIKMASIIEEEARTEETRRIIAGILWKRFDEGMPLQVDAAFAFVNGKKASADLTLDDLKIDSPYNTYVYKGLPPTPISNPGLDAVSATIRPIKTSYYFYLSDANGDMHYAVTHDEHVMNKDKYLR